MRVVSIFLCVLALTSFWSCDKRKTPLFQETTSFEQNSAYIPFDLVKEGQRVSVYATVHIDYITTSEYKLQVLLTNPEGEVKSTTIERMPEGEVDPTKEVQGGFVELKRQEATDEYKLFDLVTKNGPYEIEFLRDSEFDGAEMDTVKVSMIPY